MEVTKDEILLCLIKAMPYSEQIDNINTDGDCVVFSWRSNTFKISQSFMAMRLLDENGMWIGDDTAILLGALLKRAYVGYVLNKE